MMKPIPFRLSHEKFHIWDITHKAQILGPELLEFSEIWGILTFKAVYLCLMGAGRIYCVSQYFSTIWLSQKKPHCFSAHMRHIYLDNNIGIIENLANISKFLILRKPKYVPDVCHTTNFFTKWENYTSKVYMIQISAWYVENWGKTDFRCSNCRIREIPLMRRDEIVFNSDMFRP